MTEPSLPPVSPDGRKYLQAIRRLLEDVEADMVRLFDAKVIPEEPYREIWHRIAECGEAMKDAELPGWEPPESLGNLPTLPPERRRRGEPRYMR